jgi:hypothetical protein
MRQTATDSTAPLQFLALITLVPVPKRSFEKPFGRLWRRRFFFKRPRWGGRPRDQPVGPRAKCQARLVIESATGVSLYGNAIAQPGFGASWFKKSYSVLGHYSVNIHF